MLDKNTWENSPLCTRGGLHARRNHNDTNGGKYQKVLNTLTLDSNSLHDEGITSFLYGDMNAQVGTPEDDPLGAAGNKKRHRLQRA